LTAASADSVSPFFAMLRSSFAELQRAYDDLLSDLQGVVFRAMNVSGSKAREIIRFRAGVAVDHAVDSGLRAFVHHLSDDQLPDVPWIEAIATLLAGRQPRTWTDVDRTRFDVALAEAQPKFPTP